MDININPYNQVAKSKKRGMDIILWPMVVWRTDFAWEVKKALEKR